MCLDAKGSWIAAIHMVNLQVFFSGEREETEGGKHYEKLKGAFRHLPECA